MKPSLFSLRLIYGILLHTPVPVSCLKVVFFFLRETTTQLPRVWVGTRKLSDSSMGMDNTFAIPFFEPYLKISIPTLDTCGDYTCVATIMHVRLPCTYVTKKHVNEEGVIRHTAVQVTLPPSESEPAGIYVCQNRTFVS